MKSLSVILLCSLFLSGCFTDITPDQLSRANLACKDQGGISYIHGNSLTRNHVVCMDGEAIFIEGKRKY